MTITQITTTLETNIWGDLLMKQAPVIVVLGLFCYFMYKYFTSQIDRKDKNSMSSGSTLNWN